MITAEMSDEVELRAEPGRLIVQSVREPRLGWAEAAKHMHAAGEDTVAAMTTSGKAYPFRVACRFQSRSGFVALDQLRTVDNERLLQRLGKWSGDTVDDVLGSLRDMFSQ